jgi:serine/threonine-protein kinase
MSLDDKRRAMAAFEQAVALDPTFARGYAASAAVAVDIGGNTVDRAMYEQARARAERAIAISPRLSGAYVARAFVRMHNDWDFSGARADLDVALGIDPNSMGVQQLLSSYLMVTGKVTESLAVQQSVVERNPLSGPAWNWLADSYLSVGDYRNARAALKRATELMPDTTSTQQLRALIELHSGNYTEALRYARLIKEPHFRDFAVAMAAWSTGQVKEAQAALQRLIDQEPDVFAAQIAIASAWQGNREQTYRWLDHALDLHDAGLMNIKTQPEFKKLHGEARFDAALRRMNLL